MMREHSFGNGILLDGTGCHLCQGLEPIGEGVIELSYNALIQTANLGCQGCWVLSEAVTKCCPAFVDLTFFEILVKVQRPMLREFIEIVVQSPQNAMSVTLDIFYDPGMYFGCYGPLLNVTDLPTQSMLALGVASALGARCLAMPCHSKRSTTSCHGWKNVR